jgi:hypothetical protein
VVGRLKAVREGGVFRRGYAKVRQHVYDTIDAAVHDHDLSYLRWE